MRKIAAVILSTLLVGACGAQQKELKQSYANMRARDSNLVHPVTGGDAPARTYRNRDYAGMKFPAVMLAPVEVVKNNSQDPDYLRFLGALRQTLAEGTLRALLASERFDAVYPPGAELSGKEAVTCRIEALPHVTPNANVVSRDPVFGDERPKLIVVFSLESPTGDEVILKYTDWAVAHWEYGAWAMENLQAEGLRIANGFAEVLKKY